MSINNLSALLQFVLIVGATGVDGKVVVDEIQMNPKFILHIVSKL